MSIKYIIPILCVALLSCETMEEALAKHETRIAAMTDAELLKECRYSWLKDVTLDAIDKRGLADETSIKYIKAEKIFIGMQTWAVECAVGFPSKINKTASALGVRYQWVYECATGNGYSLPCKYVYIRNGKVTSYQFLDD